MQEQVKQVASRIRELREIFGATPAELAQAFQVTEEDYRRYESGTADIPVGILYQIAQRFGVELTTLLTGEEPRLHTYALTRRGSGVPVERRKAYEYQNLAHNFVRKRAEPFLITVAPGAENAPEHVNSHPGQEFHYVLEGTLRVMLDRHEIVLEPGDSLYFDSSVAHSLTALNHAPVKLLAVIL
jgi:quercetin dioxygenase-like cupin family protein